jgi:hypothetical protein
MNAAPLGSPPAAEAPSRAGWPGQRWFALIVLVLAAQLGLVFFLGEKHFTPQRPMGIVPKLKLAGESDELLALDDPTLFAVPHARDFTAGVWRQPRIVQPSFRWTAPAGELPQPAANNLGATFAQFMKTNRFAEPPLEFKPALPVTAPVLPVQPVFAENSWMQIEGGLAQRKLLGSVNLTNWPYSDMIAPSRVQVLVDTDGAVVSAVLLPAGNGIGATAAYAIADQRALEIARSVRFAPGTRLTVGVMIFNWRTVPPPASDLLDHS